MKTDRSFVGFRDRPYGGHFFLAIILTAAFSSVASAWNLVHLSSYDSPNHELLDIEIYGNYAFVPAGIGGLNIIDISDPSSPVFVSSYSAYEGCEYGRLYAWYVSGGYAYGSGRQCGIKVLDVTDLSNPVHVADHATGGRSYEHSDGFSTGDGEAYLYAAVHADGVEVIDISTPDAPKLLTRVATENAWAVEVSENGEFVYVADGTGGLKVIDVTVPGAARLVGGVASSGTAKDLAAAGNFVFVAVGAQGVDMFDVSDATHPLLVANYNTTGYASRVALSDSLVAVSDWDDVEILRWNDPPSLSLAGYKKTGGRVMAIHMRDDIVYSAEWRHFRTFRFGPIEDPDIDLSLRAVDFPRTEEGACRDTVLIVTNNGLSPLVLQSLNLNHEDYEITLPMEALQPGDSIEAEIKYCASSESGRTQLTIESNDPDEPEVEVMLEGNSPFGIDVGDAAPDFTLSFVNGSGEITLSELRGQIVVVAFFATW